MNLTLFLTILVEPSFYLYFTTNEDYFYFYSSNTSAYLFGRNDTVYLKLVDRGVVKEYNPIIPEQEPTYECKSFNKWHLLLALFIGFVFGFPIPVDSLFETIKAKRLEIVQQ